MTELEDVEFSPDSTMEVHKEGALKLICANFRSHEDGLPEWLKNSSDMYIRRNAEPEDSVIVLLFKHGNSGQLTAIGCLDFGGMTTQDIEQKFKTWADPDASVGGDGGAVEGGHGNGGKCYMTQLFSSHSYVHTLRDGRGSKYGFKGGAFTPGYFPSVDRGRGYTVSDPEAELARALADFGMNPSDLPAQAQAAWARSRGFTLVAGFGAKYHERKRLPVGNWLKSLQGHQQAQNAIGRNAVYVFVNGKPARDASPLTLPEIDPLPGAEAPRHIPVPLELPDPDNDGEMVATGATPASELVLRTSEKKMTHGLRSRHTIQGTTESGRTTGFWDVRELSRAAYASNIYGALSLNALDGYKQNDRRRHTNSPLVRAVEDWLSKQIDAYSGEFVKIDRLQASEEEKDELRRMNDLLDSWKNRFLMSEFGEAGVGGRGGDGPISPPPPPMPRGTPSRLDLSFTHGRAGQGVALKPKLEFFDDEGMRIRPVPFVWESSDWAVASFDENLNVLQTHSPGTTAIRAVCKDSGLASNTVAFEVVDIERINLTPTELVVGLGRRAMIEARVHTRDGRMLDGVYLIWTEGNGEIVSVGSGGSVFGLALGNTTVAAGDDQADADQQVVVEVVEVEEQKDGGGGFPRVLLSEIDQDPDSGEVLVLSSSEPPVHQRPIDFDRNIWWINMASPLARRHLDTARGGGAKSAEWRAYLVERYIEAMVKIVLTYDFENGEELTFETMLRRWDEEASIWQQRMSESLADFLDGAPLSEAA